MIVYYWLVLIEGKCNLALYARVLGYSGYNTVSMPSSKRGIPAMCHTAEGSWFSVVNNLLLENTSGAGKINWTIAPAFSLLSIALLLYSRKACFYLCLVLKPGVGRYRKWGLLLPSTSCSVALKIKSNVHIFTETVPQMFFDRVPIPLLCAPSPWAVCKDYSYLGWQSKRSFCSVRIS